MALARQHGRTQNPGPDTGWPECIVVPLGPSVEWGHPLPYGPLRLQFRITSQPQNSSIAVCQKITCTPYACRAPPATPEAAHVAEAGALHGPRAARWPAAATPALIHTPPARRGRRRRRGRPPGCQLPQAPQQYVAQRAGRRAGGRTAGHPSLQVQTQSWASKGAQLRTYGGGGWL